MKYVCTVCGYVYDEETGDPDNGIAPGTPITASRPAPCGRMSPTTSPARSAA